MTKDLKKMYRTILGDHFPPRMEITFQDEKKKQTLVYEKAGWTIGGETRGLRYGENPSQEAALYRLVNGNLVLGEVAMIKPGRWLCSDVELLQSGKHPGKINLTDVDAALNILRYLSDRPTVVIVKHNNPCGVAQDRALVKAYLKADLADRIAAFGGAIVMNRACDRATADEIAKRYAEVVAAPEFEEGAMAALTKMTGSWVGEKRVRSSETKSSALPSGRWTSANTRSNGCLSSSARASPSDVAVTISARVCSYPRPYTSPAA
jgi:phosphoribosylaminoimidazolecarboxamide formyltransferase/IMP cyclohydrolase